MSSTYDTSKNKTQQIRDKLDQLIEKSRTDEPVIGKPHLFCEVMDFIRIHEEFMLDEKQIDFIINFFKPPFGHYYFRNDFYIYFDKVLKSAEKIGDSDLTTKVYLSLSLVHDVDKEIAIIENGISLLISSKSYNNAGRLYLHLAWANDGMVKTSKDLEQHINIEKRMMYCEKSLELLDKSTFEYARGISITKYLCLEKNVEKDRNIHFNVFSTKVKSHEDKTAFTNDICWWIPSEIKDPLCFDLPVMRGYDKLTATNYREELTITDKSLAVGESNDENNTLAYVANDAVVTTQIGEFHECQAFKYTRNDMTIENYLAPDIGLVRVVAKETDGKIYDYELCDYTIKGGDGLFPLCIGNKWCYKQRACPDWAELIIEREIVSQDEEGYIISGLDYIYMKPDRSAPH